MNNQQMYILLAAPMLFNALIATALILYMNSKFDGLRDLWRAELRRVEEVTDARLKDLEERAR